MTSHQQPKHSQPPWRRTAVASAAGALTFGALLAPGAAPLKFISAPGEMAPLRMVATAAEPPDLPWHTPETFYLDHVPAPVYSSTASTSGKRVRTIGWPGSPPATRVALPRPVTPQLLLDLPDARTAPPAWAVGDRSLAQTLHFTGWPWDPGQLLAGG